MRKRKEKTIKKNPLEDWYKASINLTNHFCLKYYNTSYSSKKITNGWSPVPHRKLGIIEIDECIFDLEDIVYCIENDAPKEDLIAYKKYKEEYEAGYDLDKDSLNQYPLTLTEFILFSKNKEQDKEKQDAEEDQIIKFLKKNYQKLWA